MIKFIRFKQKINDKCEYYETINLNHLVNDNKISYKYSLFSVLVHSGKGSNSGHYYVFIKPKINGIWYKFNDDFVEKASEYQVFEANFGGTITEQKYSKSKIKFLIVYLLLIYFAY